WGPGYFSPGTVRRGADGGRSAARPTVDARLLGPANGVQHRVAGFEVAERRARDAVLEALHHGVDHVLPVGGIAGVGDELARLVGQVVGDELLDDRLLGQRLGADVDEQRARQRGVGVRLDRRGAGGDAAVAAVD